MTPTQKKNIGNGVRRAFIRKRQSDAMKASWARRRVLQAAAESRAYREALPEIATNSSTPPGVPNSQQLIAQICRNHMISEFTFGQLDDLVTLCEAFHEARSNE